MTASGTLGPSAVGPAACTFVLPKPLHGWREFAGEVGIIVLGVLIALGFGKVVEEWQWHDEVRSTRQAIAKELANAAAQAAERVAIQDCLRDRLDELATEEIERQKAWRLLMERHSNLAGFQIPDASEAVFMRAACKYISVLDFSQGLGHREQLEINDQGAPEGIEVRKDSWGVAVAGVDAELVRSG